MESPVASNQTQPNNKKKRNILVLIGSILSNAAAAITLLLMEQAIIYLSTPGGLVYDDAPMGSLKTFFVLFSLISLGLHILRSNFFTWLMIPILIFMTVDFHQLLDPSFSEFSQYQDSGFQDTETRIASENLSAYKGIANYPLVMCILYIAVIGRSIFPLLLKRFQTQ